jgi:hypothetical protein
MTSVRVRDSREDRRREDARQTDGDDRAPDSEGVGRAADAASADGVSGADEWAAILAEVPPDGQSADMLGQLLDQQSAVDFEALSRQGVADALRSCERHISWYQALQLRLLSVFPGTALPSGMVPPPEFTAAEVSTLLRCSESVAQQKLLLAQELTDRLPDTLAELRSGRLGLLQAVAMAEYTRVLDREKTAAVEQQVLSRVIGATPSQTKAVLRRAIQRVDPEGARARHERRRRDRRVEHTPDIDGMAWMSALLPAEQAAKAGAVVDAHARELRSVDTEGRTLDQLRADALVDLVCNRGMAKPQEGEATSADDTSLGTDSSSGVRININVTVSRETLMGHRDDGGVLEGYGPITADQARELAYHKAAVWHRLLIDTDGRALKVTPNVYRPGAALRRLVEARDTHCSFPTCRMPARSCDLDHIEPFDGGGRTTQENLGAACRHHHRMKHEGGWQVRRDPKSGCTVWTAPTGHRYVNHPADHRL